MRQVDQPENFGGFGPKVEKPGMPKRHERIGNGVFKAPDGKFQTQIPPPPPAPNPTIWELYGVSTPNKGTP